MPVDSERRLKRPNLGGRRPEDGEQMSLLNLKLVLFDLLCPGPEAGGEPVSAVLARPGLFLNAVLRFNSAVRNGQTV